jgi:hypothetical protein
MATQKQVIDYIQQKYLHESISEFGVKLQWSLVGGRTQEVYAVVTEDELQVTSPVAWQSDVSAEDVLEKNTTMFGVVSINGAFALKHNAFITDIDESEIDDAFTVLSFWADQLEKELGSEDNF